MKKLFCVLALLLVLPRAGAVNARAAVVIDADTGETLFEQTADSRLPMASTTKIMTALVALGEGDLDRVYTVKPEYAAVEGSSMYLKAGETLSLRDTLYGLMLASGNDAAVAIAGECGGMTAFVGKMNAKAAELGLTDTHFDNPNGLPSDTHYTTAHELAKITAAALKDPVFRQIVSTKSCTVSGACAEQSQPSAEHVRRCDRRENRLYAGGRAVSGLGGRAQRAHHHRGDAQ